MVSRMNCQKNFDTLPDGPVNAIRKTVHTQVWMQTCTIYTEIYTRWYSFKIRPWRWYGIYMVVCGREYIQRNVQGSRDFKVTTIYNAQRPWINGIIARAHVLRLLDIIIFICLMVSYVWMTMGGWSFLHSSVRVHYNVFPHFPRGWTKQWRGHEANLGVFVETCNAANRHRSSLDPIQPSPTKECDG